MMPLTAIKKDTKEPSKVYIDLNCDLGQSYGVYKNETEFELLDYVSSVNISCGSHAGDPLTIMNALKFAKEKNIAVGAHIGFPDIQGFGYRPMQLSEEELQAIVLYQIGALSVMAKAYNVEIEHVRPHGALYKLAAQDFNVSLNIAKAIAKYNSWLIYVGAAGENLSKVSEEAKIRVTHEIFLDKTYNFDGSIDFDAPDKTDLNYSVSQLNSVISNSSVKNNRNGHTKVEFNTIHLSLKNEHSLEIAKRAKELVIKPAPMSLTLIGDDGWL